MKKKKVSKTERKREIEILSWCFWLVSVSRTHCHLCKLGLIFRFQLVRESWGRCMVSEFYKIKELLCLIASAVYLGFIPLSQDKSKTDTLLWSLCSSWNMYWALNSVDSTFKYYTWRLNVCSELSFTEHSLLNSIYFLVYKTLDNTTEHNIFYMIGICLCSYMEFCFEFDTDFRVWVSTFIDHVKE